MTRADLIKQADGLEALAKRYEDTMGLTREGAIRRIGVMHDALLDAAATLHALANTSCT